MSDMKKKTNETDQCTAPPRDLERQAESDGACRQKWRRRATTVVSNCRIISKPTMLGRESRDSYRQQNYEEPEYSYSYINGELGSLPSFYYGNYRSLFYFLCFFVIVFYDFLFTKTFRLFFIKLLSMNR